MITVDYNRGRGVSENSKTDYVILEQPLNFILILGLVVRLVWLFWGLLNIG